MVFALGGAAVVGKENGLDPCGSKTEEPTKTLPKMQKWHVKLYADEHPAPPLRLTSPERDRPTAGPRFARARSLARQKQHPPAVVKRGCMLT